MIFLRTSELPWRLSVEELPHGGLWFSGAPDFSRPRVGIVGSRTAPNEALAFVTGVAGGLARRGIDVVSGGALGVDGAAHLGGLQSPDTAKTWLVSPAGLGLPSPPRQKDLFDEVTRRGTLVSQFEPGTAALRHRYLARNAVLTALVDVLVLVQGSARSGTRHCAGCAIDRGVPVLVMAGPVWDPTFHANREIAARRGARWITSEAELRDSILLATAAHRPLTPQTPELTRTTRALLALLTAEPRHLDWVAEQSGLPMAELSPVLLTLCLEDVVKEGPAGFWAIGSRSPGNYV